MSKVKTYTLQQVKEAQEIAFQKYLQNDQRDKEPSARLIGAFEAQMEIALINMKGA